MNNDERENKSMLKVKSRKSKVESRKSIVEGYSRDLISPPSSFEISLVTDNNSAYSLSVMYFSSDAICSMDLTSPDEPFAISRKC